MSFSAFPWHLWIFIIYPINSIHDYTTVLRTCLLYPYYISVSHARHSTCGGSRQRHLQFRRSAILAEHFLSCRKKLSHMIRKHRIQRSGALTLFLRPKNSVHHKSCIIKLITASGQCDNSVTQLRYNTAFKAGTAA